MTHYYIFCCIVFQGCLKDGGEVFRCPPEHVIDIHQVEVGIVPNDVDAGSEQCSLDETICSRQITGTSIMSYCNKKTVCDMTPEITRRLRNFTCSGEGCIFAIKIEYYCGKRPTDEGSFLQDCFVQLA